MKNLRIGQGIEYFVNNYSDAQYGIVLGVSDECIEFASVRFKSMFVRCYDEPGANKDVHKDNVRLKHCPPPFTAISGGKNGGAYVYADMNNLISFSREDCQKYRVRVIDGGQKVPEPDMKEIRNHPWPEQLQRERIRKPVGRASLLESKFAEIAAQDDVEHGDDGYSL